MKTVFEHQEALSEGGEFEKGDLALGVGREGIDVPPDPHGPRRTVLGVGVYPW